MNVGHVSWNFQSDRREDRVGDKSDPKANTNEPSPNNKTKSESKNNVVRHQWVPEANTFDVLPKNTTRTAQ